MKYRGRSGEKSFIKPDQNLVEIFTLISGVVAPIFVMIWVRLYPELPHDFQWSAWIVSFSFTFLYILIHASKFIRKKISYFFYSLCYIESSFIICLANYNKFSEGYSLVLLLIVFFIALTFEKLRSLIVYLIAILTSVISILYIEAMHSGKLVSNGVVIIICLIVFSIIVLLNLFIRIEDKRALSESKKNYQSLLDTSPDGIIVYDKEKIAFANEAIARLINVADKKSIVGQSVFDYLHLADREAILEEIERVYSGNELGYMEGKIHFANGKFVDVEVASMITTYNGKDAVMTTLRDISNRKRMEVELKEAESKYRNIVEGSLAGIYLIQNGKLNYFNKYFEKTFGYSEEELYNMSFLELVSEEYRDRVVNGVKRLIATKEEMVLEIKGIKKDGSIINLDINSKSIVYNGIPSVIGMVLDITERKKAEEKINQMAHYDPVTGLPNRYSLNQYLNKSMESMKNNSQSAAIMFIDLDRFKIINDTMGHSFGDILLEKAAKEIKGCLEEEDFVSRYGGDEFIIVLPNAVCGRVKATAQKILDRFSSPLIIEENRIIITPSIGISFYPGDGKDEETLIKYADTAMYRAKSLGRNNFQFYKPEMNREVSRSMMLESGLRHALEKGEFIVHYQPQIDFISGSICGAEALIRWKHPEFGLVPPNEFIPLAEETGLIIPIGEWVMKTACKQNKLWQDAGLPPINMAVNVSNLQFKYSGFVDSIQLALKESGLSPEYLELEITESTLRDMDELKVVIDELDPIGVKLSIDDFGVGYSSLSMLQHIAIKNLKVDQSFIRDTPENSKSANIVRTIINMGKYLDCNIIAEGIETKEQENFLRENNCNAGQGYLFSRPVEAKYFEELLRSWSNN